MDVAVGFAVAVAVAVAVGFNGFVATIRTCQEIEWSPVCRIFTALASRPFQSISRDVRLSFAVCFDPLNVTFY